MNDTRFLVQNDEQKRKGDPKMKIPPTLTNPHSLGTVPEMKATAEKLFPGDPAGQREMTRTLCRGSAADADLNAPGVQDHVHRLAQELLPVLGGTIPAMVAFLATREVGR